jgi:hypothetical protein
LRIAHCGKTRGYKAVGGIGWQQNENGTWNWNGFLPLPSLRSLQDYSHFKIETPGWHESTFKELISLCKERRLSGHGT